jgi:hypothetical protein
MTAKERSTEIKGDAEFNHSHDVSNFLLNQKREIKGRSFSSDGGGTAEVRVTADYLQSPEIGSLLSQS